MMTAAAIALGLIIDQSGAPVHGFGNAAVTVSKQVSPPAGPPPPPPTLARPPRPIEPGTWVTQNDYPVGALATNQQGVVGFRVQVGLDGTVSECVVTAPSGWPLLDEMTCALIALRARFTPATNARGDRIRGTYSNRIRWQIPPPAPPVDGNPGIPVPPGR